MSQTRPLDPLWNAWVRMRHILVSVYEVSRQKEEVQHFGVSTEGLMRMFIDETLLRA